jgi:hypothetical protein
MGLAPLYRLAQSSTIWQKKGRFESGLSLGRKRPTRAMQQSLAAMQKLTIARFDAIPNRRILRQNTQFLVPMLHYCHAV